MIKIDFKKELKHLYNSPSREVVFVDVPKMNFLMADGTGNPNTSQQYTEVIEALYAVSYTLKFMIKKGKMAFDYGVLPLEGLWWTHDMARFSVENKNIWKWTAMIMQPEFVTKEMFSEAVKQVEKKKDPTALSKIRFESFFEGLSAQIMHIGTYSEEGPTIEKLHKFIHENCHELSGKHHEIYLSDPNKASPEKMKTIIRQPVKK